MAQKPHCMDKDVAEARAAVAAAAVKITTCRSVTVVVSKIIETMDTISKDALRAVISGQPLCWLLRLPALVSRAWNFVTRTVVETYPKLEFSECGDQHGMTAGELGALAICSSLESVELDFSYLIGCLGFPGAADWIVQLLANNKPSRVHCYDYDDDEFSE